VCGVCGWEGGYAIENFDPLCNGYAWTRRAPCRRTIREMMLDCEGVISCASYVSYGGLISIPENTVLL
jgi:hypothetical protein